MKILNYICMGIGYSIITLLTIGFISQKIEDIKSKKTVLKKSTTFFVDGQKYTLKKDLVLKFKKVRALQCKCESKEGLIVNNFVMSKSLAIDELKQELAYGYNTNPKVFKDLICIEE